MIRKITLLLTTIFITSIAYSQCTPDAQYTTAGFYTSAGANKLPDAIIGVAYDEVITIVSIKDTVVFGVTVNVDSIVLKSLVNLPPGIVHSTPSNTINGGDKGCIRLQGKATGSTGPVSVQIDVDIYLVGAGVSNQKEDFVMNVIWPVSTKESLLINSDEVVIAPNPVKGKSTFYLNNKIKGKVELRIHNLLGEKVFGVEHFAEEINSEIEFDASNLPSGVYTYSLISDGSNSIGRIIIAQQ